MTGNRSFINNDNVGAPSSVSAVFFLLIPTQSTKSNASDITIIDSAVMRLLTNLIA